MAEKKTPTPTISRNFSPPEKSHSSDLAWLRQTLKNRREMLLHFWWPKKECSLPRHHFRPSKSSGQSFLWISKLQLREPSAVLPEPGAGGTQRATTPEQKPLEKTGEGTGEMPVLWAERTKDRPSFSCDPSLSLSAHFTSYISFGSSGRRAEAARNRLGGATNGSDAQVFSQLILCSGSADW